MMSDIESICRKMKMPDLAVREFLSLHAKFLKGPALVENWETLEAPGESFLVDYEALAPSESTQEPDHLNRLVVLKLNGGLGTGMGCRGAKSCMTAKNGKTFLDLIVEQMQVLQHKAPVPLVLMNSFYTQEETLRVVQNYQNKIPLDTFEQNRFPRLDAETLLPLDSVAEGDEIWYPPGHGDLYSCIQQQGFLDRWLEEGREVLFASNADNLGAVVDQCILRFMLNRRVPILVELTPKTPVDVKGGTVYQRDGRLKLLEIGNVPPSCLEEFQGINKFRVFNTNNIWIHLPQLKERLKEGPLDLGLVVNHKMVRDRKVIQLETAMGAGLENFESPVGLVVPRTRFIPVKNTSDLLRVRSDIYQETNGLLALNPALSGMMLPQVKLKGPLENVDELERRIPVPPSMAQLDSLEVEGDVRFIGKVELKGQVKIISEKKPLTLKEGQVLCDETIASE